MITKTSFSFIFLALAIISGCASSPKLYNYAVEPTPLQKGSSRYALENINVNLTLGHGAKEGDTRFADEQTLTKQFTEALIKALAERNILADSDADADANLAITIDYTRIYNIGGNALNAPRVTHHISAYNDEGELASFSHHNYMVTHGMGANIKISAFKWGPEDELKDVAKVAAIIARYIHDMGQ